MRRASFAVASIALASFLVQCGVRYETVPIPPEYAGDIRSRDVERGGYVFHHTCAACHRGRVNPAGYAWEPWRMRRQVREGNYMMPPIKTSLVSESDLEAVLAYLTTIGAVDGELPPLPRREEPRAVLDAGTDAGPSDAGVDGGVLADGAVGFAGTGPDGGALDAAMRDGGLSLGSDGGGQVDAGVAPSAAARTRPSEPSRELGRPSPR